MLKIFCNIKGFIKFFDIVKIGLKSVEREKSIKSRSSALNSRTDLTKILMLIEKFQAFHIRCIMLILGKLHYLPKISISCSLVKL